MMPPAMKKHIAHRFLYALVVVAVACRPASKESQSDAGAERSPSAASSSAASLSAAPSAAPAAETPKPTESGYADVNKLKLYYEVYGAGKPLVLLHGSYMNIPMNWAGAIPMLAKARRVIVAEMQGHGRTKDVPREFSYEAMADDV